MKKNLYRKKKKKKSLDLRYNMNEKNARAYLPEPGYLRISFLVAAVLSVSLPVFHTYSTFTSI